MKKLKTFLILFLVIAVGVGATIHFAHMIYHDQQKKIANHFQRASNDITQKMQKDLLLAQEAITLTTAFFDASNFITQQEFQTFTRRFLEGSYGIQSLTWIPKISNKQRQEYVQRAQEFYPDFRIRILDKNQQLIQAPQKTVYYPVYYAEPYKGNESVLGFDAGTNPEQRKAMQKAAQTNNIAATIPLKLPQKTSQQYKVLVFAPVCKNRELSGFVSGTYIIDQLLKNALKLATQDMGMSITDITAQDNEILLYNTLKDNDAIHTKSASIESKMQTHALHYHYNIRFVDRIWHIHLMPRTGYYEIPLQTIFFMMLELLVGIMVTSLLSFIVWKFLRQRMLLEKETDALTKEVNELLYKDRTTNLPSRFSVDDMIETCISNIKTKNGKLTVLYLHVDNFDLVGQVLGLDALNDLLKKIAARLKEIISSRDEIAHMGNNKFVIITPRDNKQSILIFIENMNKKMNAPITIQNKTFNFSSSVGAALYPESGVNAKFLLKNAQTAMAKAKQQKGNSIVFYDLELHADISKNQSIDLGLQKALQNNEFYLMYQPQVDLKTENLMGAEALIRWKSPILGNVPPDKFIPIAQQNGTLTPITAWVLETACKQAAEWQRQGLPKVPISVNVPGGYFQRPDFNSILEDTLKKTGLKPEYLEIEITERSLVQKSGSIGDIYQFLAKKKIKLAIDDFGTGYSNLSYLPQLHIDKLKIDISFVRGLPSDRDSVTITTAIINLAHSLNIPVIAEGIETEEQAAFLKKLGCDNAQGFYYSKPLLPEDFASYTKILTLSNDDHSANKKMRKKRPAKRSHIKQKTRSK